MISTGELRKGVTIELDGKLYTIIDYEHIKVGRGSAKVRMKLKDVRAGHTIEKTFQAGERFPRARLERAKVQYLYSDGELYHFMYQENYEQTGLTKELLGDVLNYLKEEMPVELLTYDGEPIGVEIPLNVELTITDTGPSFKGDTAAGGTKPAVTETGLVVQVPLFLNNGDKIKVDTRTGSYLERA
jgi:elongation factor P